MRALKKQVDGGAYGVKLPYVVSPFVDGEDGFEIGTGGAVERECEEHSRSTGTVSRGIPKGPFGVRPIGGGLGLGGGDGGTVGVGYVVVVSNRGNHNSAVVGGSHGLGGGALTGATVFLGREQGGVGGGVVIGGVPVGWGVLVPMMSGGVVNSGCDLLGGGQSGFGMEVGVTCVPDRVIEDDGGVGAALELVGSGGEGGVGEWGSVCCFAAEAKMFWRVF